MGVSTVILHHIISHQANMILTRQETRFRFLITIDWVNLTTIIIYAKEEK